MSTSIDIYCERLGPEIWAEPINAMTNLAFIIAAMLLVLRTKQTKTLNVEIGLLIALLSAIGIGSAAFHTLATRGAMLADVIPILLFQIAFLIIYARRVMALSPIFIFRLLMGYILLTIGFEALPREWMNGSLGYMPAIIFLIGFGIYHHHKQKNAPNILLIAGGLFLVSLTFRSIDMAICDHLSIGTHFLWHVLNAAVLYLCVISLILNPRKTIP